MYRHEMTEKQLERKDLFNERLRAARWNLGEWDELLESDAVNVSPEATATYQSSISFLTLEYHAAEDYVALGLHDAPDEAVRFRFHCGETLAEALSVITTAQDAVSRADYMSVLQDLLEVCPETYAEVGETLVKIEFEDEEGDPAKTS
jgi:hypothetical protein